MSIKYCSGERFSRRPNHADVRKTFLQKPTGTNHPGTQHPARQLQETKLSTWRQKHAPVHNILLQSTLLMVDLFDVGQQVTTITRAYMTHMMRANTCERNLGVISTQFRRIATKRASLHLKDSFIYTSHLLCGLCMYIHRSTLVHIYTHRLISFHSNTADRRLISMFLRNTILNFKHI